MPALYLPCITESASLYESIWVCADFILANPAVKLTGHIPKTLDVD